MRMKTTATTMRMNTKMMMMIMMKTTITTLRKIMRVMMTRVISGPIPRPVWIPSIQSNRGAAAVVVVVHPCHLHLVVVVVVGRRRFGREPRPHRRPLPRFTTSSFLVVWTASWRYPSGPTRPGLVEPGASLMASRFWRMPGLLNPHPRDDDDDDCHQSLMKNSRNTTTTTTIMMIMRMVGTTMVTTTRNQTRTLEL